MAARSSYSCATATNSTASEEPKRSSNHNDPQNRVDNDAKDGGDDHDDDGDKDVYQHGYSLPSAGDCQKQNEGSAGLLRNWTGGPRLIRRRGPSPPRARRQQGWTAPSSPPVHEIHALSKGGPWNYPHDPSTKRSRHHRASFAGTDTD